MNYTGTDRRRESRSPDGPICRGEFDRFVDKTIEYRDKAEGILTRLETALFAPDSGNANGQPGLMVTARNIDQHITAVCNITKWAYRTVLAVVAVGAPAIAIAKAMGWL